jgi:hypothetical protein
LRLAHVHEVAEVEQEIHFRVCGERARRVARREQGVAVSASDPGEGGGVVAVRSLDIRDDAEAAEEGGRRGGGGYFLVSGSKREKERE